MGQMEFEDSCYERNFMVFTLQDDLVPWVDPLKHEIPQAKENTKNGENRARTGKNLHKNTHHGPCDLVSFPVCIG